MRSTSRILKTTTVITLSFFLWSFGPLYAPLAYAAEKKPAKAKGNSPTSAGTPRDTTAPGSAERFEKALDAIRENVTRAGEKAANGSDDSAERVAIKAKRTEIEAADADLKKEFAATEKKLKAANLPDTLRQRHTAFVAQYEKNLKELKANLDNIDKAATKTDRAARLQKAITHLDKVKKPTRSKDVKPGRYPHQTRELKKVQTSWNIIVDWLVPSAEAAESPPTTADLVETLETPQAQEIKDLAQQLGGTAVSLYEYVRNVYPYEPYSGSTKGALQTLKEKTGNEWDQASLLIALYRASGIPARYVVGTVEIPVDQFTNWLGISDPITAGSLLLTLGKTTKLVYTGGKITALRTQHVWVRAYVPFLYSRGATTNPGDKWVDVDPSFKGQSITTTVTDTSVPAYDQAGYLSTFRSASPLDYYKTQLQTHIDANHPGYVPEALAPTSEITAERLGILIGQLPFKIVSLDGTYTEVPDAYRQKFTVSLTDPSSGEPNLSYAASMPTIIGKRLTLSYAPATSADEALIAYYQGLYNVPAYLLNVKPQLKHEGVVIAEGNAIGFGTEQNMELLFDTTIDTGRVDNTVIAGGYYAISLSTRYGGTRDDILKRTAQLAMLAGTIDFSEPATLDDKLGEILYLSGVVYHQNLDSLTKQIATFNQVVDVRDVSEMMYFLTVNVNSVFGVPNTVKPVGITGDMDRNLHTVAPMDGDTKRSKLFMQSIGDVSSYFEHYVTESIYQTEAISAVKALQLAHDQGISVHTISSDNVNELATLQLSAELETAIANAIYAGNQVIVPEKNLTVGNWTGVGYIVQDPISGKGAYMISGGYGGAATINNAAVEDKLRAAMADYANYIQHSGMPRLVRFPGPDNMLYTSDDVTYSEVSMYELHPDELDACEAANDPACSLRYGVSHVDIAQPLIDIYDNGDTSLSAHVTVGKWKSQDGARYMRTGTAILQTIEWLVGYFFTQKHGEGTSGITSGYRTKTHNAKIAKKGVLSKSHHVDGVAADTKLSAAGASGVPTPQRCEVLKEAKALAGGIGEILAEGVYSFVHIAVPATRPHTDEADKNTRSQWSCK